jgi:hypothetical protein
MRVYDVLARYAIGSCLLKYAKKWGGMKMMKEKIRDLSDRP